MSARGRRAAAVVALLAGLVTPARAHWTPPEAIVAELNGEPSRARWGIERALCDPKAPRLLVVRVGERWYAHPAEARRLIAAEWRTTWRHSVTDGVVSILDAATDRVVVRFAPGGAVVDVADR